MGTYPFSYGACFHNRSLRGTRLIGRVGIVRDLGSRRISLRPLLHGDRLTTFEVRGSKPEVWRGTSNGYAGNTDNRDRRNPGIIAREIPAATAPAYGTARWLRALAAGLLGGVLATLAMLLSMVALRITLGIPAPAESIPDRIAPLLRIPEFFSLFDRFGGYNGLKRFGVLSILAGMVAVGVGVGVLYALFTENSRTAAPMKPRRFGLSPTALSFIAIVVMLLWVGTLALLQPVLDSNFRGFLRHRRRSSPSSGCSSPT